MPEQLKVCLFIRVSTQQQDYDRQISDLTSYCAQKGYAISKTIATKITGTKTLADRQDLQELLAAANRNEFQKVIVCEISRIGRNARDIRNTIDQLHRKKIAVVFKNLGLESIDENGNESFVTNIIIAIYSELAQEEKRILSERIKSGLAEARRKNKRIGRPTGKENIQEINKKYGKLISDLRKGTSLTDCSKLHSVSRNTVIKIKKLMAA
ncbi:MAG: recombinase family protein [Bacteroidetes bacterium]|nr:MAG: recombinase family protein [Bacteroidota bacterium]